ncbi:hypothetical protein DASC09_007770 [Saccharomycopsis crataegensis]|uniref:Uncharacterized protein n=1 Tax=Saccharomycopsis crataegensis TaxID=43959 RepID=A0AAV5QFQ4_9ASCO|nr:hypothetical protein DASC09_007770 [Saccharomycopsis crataegensis]
MNFNAKEKIAVVTGSSRGLGYVFAEALIIGGAKRVYINSRSKDACDKAVSSLSEFCETHGKSTNIVAIPSNLNNGAGVRKLVDGVLANGDSKIDILIANAGASWGASFESHPEEALSKVIDLNLKGVFLTIQQFAPLLSKPQGVDPSRILINASITGLYSSKNGNVYGYTASKAAIIHLGKTLALQLPERYNVNVNTVCPGFFPSRMSNGVLSKFGKDYIKENPRNRMGDARQDLIPLILFLCDEKTNYLNGMVLSVDGGYHLNGPNL